MLLKWKEWPKNVQNQLKMTKIMQIIGCVAVFKNFCSGPVPGRTARLFSGPVVHYLKIQEWRNEGV